ncbi:haloacid dehalogenase type II [Microbulbifer sp. SAOS-129_SWC]|uniref:haloacid dehalogenase type II n=1 Tax=Microbulbifer sp. SAOS-129_SWC TaxID=3145235 RepID=UPI0032169F34
MTKRVIFFDVIETLFSLKPMERAFDELKLPANTGKLFFAQLLRDAFALSATGVFKPFPELARATLEVVLQNAQGQAEEGQIKQILGTFAELPAHPDVQPALSRVKDDPATQAVLLTNGSQANTEALVRQAGIGELVNAIISIESLDVWKPRADVYQGAARKMNVAPEQATLIAAHAWDTHGAMRAGLQAVWVRRQDRVYHGLMDAPAAQADDLEQAVEVALGR